MAYLVPAVACAAIVGAGIVGLSHSPLVSDGDGGHARVPDGEPAKRSGAHRPPAVVGGHGRDRAGP